MEAINSKLAGSYTLAFLPVPYSSCINLNAITRLNVNTTMALFGHMSATPDIKIYSSEYEDYLAGIAEISVVGRLQRGASYMQHLKASNYSLRIMRQGYTIPLCHNPTPVFLRNNRSSRLQPKFVQSEIDNLLASGAIIETTCPATVTNPLSVAQKHGKMRLVLDLRHVNPLVQQAKFKLEGLEPFLNTVDPSGFMIAFDLKSGFHHIQMDAAQQQFLGFSYPDHTGRQRYFRFVVLPFGLASATLVFSKMLRQLIKVWRSNGIKCFIFIDDGISSHLSQWQLAKHGHIIKRDLLLAGWVPHRQKSNWIPTRILAWLCFDIDMLHNVIKISSEKLDRALDIINYMIAEQQVKARVLAKAIGTMISLAQALGDLVYLHTKHHKYF